MIEKDPLDACAQEFWDQVEKEAAELEVTVDYYLEEFFCS
tara:strand:- start:1646 stop:1765 length:120 start_codon:yes stop_codon:yes gene_type:complete